MLRSAFIIGIIVSGTAALAEPAPLKGTAIKEMVPGAVIHIDTPLGSRLPVRFTGDGLMSGEAGGLASYLGSANDRGRWWVENDKLCQKWFKWFDAEVKCLQLRQQGQRIFWSSDDGKSGTATIAMRAAPLAAPPLAPAYAMSLHAPRVGTLQPSAEPTEAVIVTKPPPAKPVAVTPSPAKPTVLNQSPLEKPAIAATPEAASKKEKPLVAARPQQSAAIVPAGGPPAKPFGQPSAPGVAQLVAPPPAAALITAPAFKVAGVEEDDVLNIRNGPSAEHPMVGAIPADGQGVRIAGSCQSEWCPIIYRGVSGWVNRLFLVEEAKLQGSAWLRTSSSRERRLPD